MAHEGYHEPISEPSDDTRDMHRAIISLMEELEAVDWYNQRVDACRDEELKAILVHNRDEEKEHAAMVLEWIRREGPDIRQGTQGLPVHGEANRSRIAVGGWAIVFGRHTNLGGFSPSSHFARHPDVGGEFERLFAKLGKGIGSVDPLSCSRHVRCGGVTGASGGIGDGFPDRECYLKAAKGRYRQAAGAVAVPRPAPRPISPRFRSLVSDSRRPFLRIPPMNDTALPKP